MGQHKYNPVAIAAKNGELPPKPKKMSKREMDRILYSMVEAKMCEYLFKYQEEKTNETHQERNP